MLGGGSIFRIPAIAGYYRNSGMIHQESTSKQGCMVAITTRQISGKLS
jgi:hypothetical protein